MIFENNNCPVCHKNERTPIYVDVVHNCSVLSVLGIKKNDDVIPTIYRCNNCSHHYLSPIINNNLLNEYYSKSNSIYYTHSDTKSNHLAKENDAIFKKINKLKSCGKVLEIGCGYGFLLDCFDKNGYETLGVEPSPQASSFAKKQLGLSIIDTFIDEDTFEPNSFDIILLFDVVEHISNIEQLKNTITKILKPDGILVIGTGDINSITAKFSGKGWSYFSCWEHVSFFSKKSLSYMIKDWKLKPIIIEKKSYKGSLFKNLVEFSKIISKKIINIPLKKDKEYKYNLCFDHLLIVAKK